MICPFCHLDAALMCHLMNNDWDVYLEENGSCLLLRFAATSYNERNRISCSLKWTAIFCNPGLAKIILIFDLRQVRNDDAILRRRCGDVLQGSQNRQRWRALESNSCTGCRLLRDAAHVVSWSDRCKRFSKIPEGLSALKAQFVDM